MLTNGRTDTRTDGQTDDGRKVITIAHPEQSSGELKIDFQDGSHLGFLIGTILAIFDLQVVPMLPIKFRVNWHLGLGEEGKNRFSRWLP